MILIVCQYHQKILNRDDQADETGLAIQGGIGIWVNNISLVYMMLIKCTQNVSYDLSAFKEKHVRKMFYLNP